MKNFITDVYDNHVREKAIEATHEKLNSVNVKIDDMAEQDYEAMVSDASKDIETDYYKKIVQVGLGLFGLDMLLGA